MIRYLFAILAALFVDGSAWPYDEITHAHMTKEALGRSYLPGSTFFIDLGIYGLDGELFLTRQYWDDAGYGRTLRNVDQDNVKDPNRFESSLLSRIKVQPSDQLRTSSWILRGTIREDDTGKPAIIGSFIRSCWDLKNPLDDPWNPGLVRVTNHFFDPVNNLPLNGPLVSASGMLSGYTPRKAPDWALGAIDAFATPPAAESTRVNHFSIADVRDAMWRALTGTGADGTVVASTAEERSQYWGTVFRAVGDVVHVVQDMAQPQHTRNDAHSGIKCLGVSGSGYEERMKARVIATVDARTSPALPAIDYGPPCNSTGGYCPVAFNSYSDYFSTRPRDGDNGKGIADYSNRGFFTADTNLGDSSYLKPLNDTANYQIVDTTGIGGRPIKVLMGFVPDLVFSTQQIKLTAPGPWNEFASARGIKGHFYITDEVMDDHASLLLPRAVAYTAGLINYMFRGTLQIDLPDERVYAAQDFSTAAEAGAGFRQLKLKVKNSTQPVGGTAQRMDAVQGPATLIAVVSYRNNTCLKVPSLEGSPYADPSDKTAQTVIWNESCRSPRLEDKPLPDIIASTPIPAPARMDDESQTVVFDFPKAIPFDAVDLDMRIVYRGPLGTESDAIAIGYELISEPNFFNFDNNRDCKGPPIGSTADCKTQPTDPDPTWDAACTISGSVKLPFWNAADEPGWRAIASVTKLLPGQYARVAYLTRSGYRRYLDNTNTGYMQVVSNQRYAYDVILTFPDGSSDFYPAKKPVTVPVFRSRKLKLTPENASQSVMFEADGSFAEYSNLCADGTQCWGTEWANTACDAIDPKPQPVTVLFP